MANAPVLLLHGFAASYERTWRAPGWTDLLADAGRSVIGVDLLGHGASAKPHDPAAYASGLAEGVEAALPADEPVDAVAFSLGAHVLLDVATRRPECFGRIVLAGVGDGILDGGTGTDEVVAAIRGEVPPDNPVLRHFAVSAAEGDNDPEALVACLQRPVRRLTEADLSRITSPVLVALGDRDFAAPGDRLAAAFPDGRLVTLRGVDHFGTPEAFAFIDAALEFLGAVPV